MLRALEFEEIDVISGASAMGCGGTIMATVGNIGMTAAVCATAEFGWTAFACAAGIIASVGGIYQSIDACSQPVAQQVSFNDNEDEGGEDSSGEGGGDGGGGGD